MSMQPRRDDSPMPDWLAASVHHSKRRRTASEKLPVQVQQEFPPSPPRSVYSTVTRVANPRPLYPEQLVPIVFPDEHERRPSWQLPTHMRRLDEGSIADSVAQEFDGQPFAPFASPGPSFVNLDPDVQMHLSPRRSFAPPLAHQHHQRYGEGFRSSPAQHPPPPTSVHRPSVLRPFPQPDPRVEYEIATPEGPEDPAPPAPASAVNSAFMTPQRPLRSPASAAKSVFGLRIHLCSFLTERVVCIGSSLGRRAFVRLFLVRSWQHTQTFPAVCQPRYQ
ncbi:hypothetical protein EXIGLDRAFT_487847 [Exidia glandulosa HHB12029]|uniref:Uncharacterized protein n=1 Tax=Exidia glandulosa HHB12029 TaxID=1314781 RepID=A0A165JNY9_EXIGL|nr:hypothetical protein EXIGLDRAFT_487847 [Exidia glandulosa HHB12029]